MVEASTTEHAARKQQATDSRHEAKQAKRAFDQAMSEFRWRKAGILPQPIRIRKRCFYRESDLIAIQARFAHSGGEAA